MTPVLRPARPRKPAGGTPTITRILAATDFSANSTRAIAYAESMARQFGADVVLLHVTETPASSGGDDARAVAAQRLEEVVAELGKRHVAARGIVRSGVPFEEIVVAAGAEGADLIVLGTRGQTGLAYLLMGSVAERVVRQASCPVLTVRGR
jgi:nucleotide-binding universal stress UspA family protein